MKYLLVWLLLTMAPLGADGQSAGFTLIVNAANPVSAMSKAQVSSLFLKQSVRWDDGRTALPVDQEKGAPVREAFSRAVHHRSAVAVNAYWQQQIFGGKEVPPAEKHNDAETLAFVRANPGAIGYVSVGVPLGDNVRTVTVR